jgi:hypothetical protein
MLSSRKSLHSAYTHNRQRMQPGTATQTVRNLQGALDVGNLVLVLGIAQQRHNVVAANGKGCHLLLPEPLTAKTAQKPHCGPWPWKGCEILLLGCAEKLRCQRHCRAGTLLRSHTLAW